MLETKSDQGDSVHDDPEEVMDELSDDELEDVAGGWTNDPSDP